MKSSASASSSTERKPYGNKLGKVMWVNGKLVASEEVTVHITAHSLHYGLAAFEGIRAYELKDKSIGIFRCQDHMQRFINSCHTGMLPLQFSLDELVDACKQAVKNAGLGACYLRPIGFLDAGPLGVYFDTEKHPFTVAVMTMDWGKYLGADAMAKGSRLKISSFTRHHPNISMTKAKYTGNYVNSVMAKLEARKMGFDEAILLDTEGYLAEGSGENLFVVKNNKIFTPTLSSVLEGVTRDTVCHIIEDMGLSLVERRITRDELYNADEAFLCGTAAEITPIAEVDMRKIGPGKPGKLTGEIQKRFFDIVTGNNPKYTSWITKV
ncbi:MAG: branched-chain amino acid transaminase [Deltaproteobacteria bacterium]|nr:branched-chain amino acid transaminase [Deltaproteobacteria bacterium]